MRPEDIRAFVERPRSEVERLKRRHWASCANDEEAGSTTLGALLYEHVREVAPTFPSTRYAREDWEHHLRLKALIDRAQAALEGR